jgi:uncharacterized protein (DUF1330 family)
VCAVVKLCVFLWATPGREAQLVEYEDRVLPLLDAYDARVLQRVRSQDPAAGPFEVQILEFPSEHALDQYMADPTRATLTSLRDAAVARTEVIRVDAIEHA